MFDVLMWILGRRLQFAGRRPQKNTANGLVRNMRRGRPLTSQTAFGGQLPYKGSLVSPVVRFGYSLFDYGGMFLRITNHEPLISLLVVNATEMFLSFWYTLRVLDKSCEF